MFRFRKAAAKRAEARATQDAWSETQQVLRAPQPPRHQFVTDGVMSDGDYSDDSLFAREMERRNRRK